MTGRRWRIFAHALDRTGPPMLVLAFARWLRQAHPADQIEVVAFRGGPLEVDLSLLGPVLVVLEDQEAWDARAVTAAQRDRLERLVGSLGQVDANLLVSVAASHPLAWVPEEAGPVVTWSVEIGEDLIWFDEYQALRDRTDVWLAGSETTRDELRERSGAVVEATIVPEFVERHRAVGPADVARLRSELGAEGADLLVLGAGIGTLRKGIDLFLELAVALDRRSTTDVAMAWIGGESDPLTGEVADLAARLAVGRLRILPGRPDLSSCFQAADLLVHTARADAFPLVALHAVLAGAPVLTFAGTGGLHEMLGDGFLGVPYPDVEALAGEVERLRHPGERAELLRHQAGRVEQRFVVDRGGERLYAELVAAADDGPEGRVS